MEGFIKINRAFLLSELYQAVKPSTVKVLFALLPEVSFTGVREYEWKCTTYRLHEREAILSCVDIAQRCDCAEATVRRAIKELSELGLLEYSRVNQGYYIEIAEGVIPSKRTKEAKEANEQKQPNCTFEDQPTEQNAQPTPYIPKKEHRMIGSKQTFKRPKKNPKLKDLSEVKDLIPHSFTGPNTLKALEDWMAYKQERKEGYTATTFKAFMTLMQKEFRTGKELHDAVYEAIARQWRGVHNTYGGYNAQ